MKLIVCVDKSGGMAFGGRRVSSDRIVTGRMLELCGGSLWIAPYSQSLFPPEAELQVAEDFLEMTGDGWCFAETVEISRWLAQAEKVAIYCWNRAYPSDLKFPMAQLNSGWRLTHSEEFAGYSHEKITLGVYEKC